eukprot:gene11865-8153_t
MSSGIHSVQQQQRGTSGSRARQRGSSSGAGWWAPSLGATPGSTTGRHTPPPPPPAREAVGSGPRRMARCGSSTTSIPGDGLYEDQPYAHHHVETPSRRSRPHAAPTPYQMEMEMEERAMRVGVHKLRRSYGYHSGRGREAEGRQRSRDRSHFTVGSRSRHASRPAIAPTYSSSSSSSPGGPSGQSYTTAASGGGPPLLSGARGPYHRTGQHAQHSSGPSSFVYGVTSPLAYATEAFLQDPPYERTDEEEEMEEGGGEEEEVGEILPVARRRGAHRQPSLEAAGAGGPYSPASTHPSAGSSQFHPSPQQDRRAGALDKESSFHAGVAPRRAGHRDGGGGTTSPHRHVVPPSTTGTTDSFVLRCPVGSNYGDGPVAPEQPERERQGSRKARSRHHSAAYSPPGRCQHLSYPLAATPAGGGEGTASSLAAGGESTKPFGAYFAKNNSSNNNNNSFPAGSERRPYASPSAVVAGGRAASALQMASFAAPMNYLTIPGGNAGNATPSSGMYPPSSISYSSVQNQSHPLTAASAALSQDVSHSDLSMSEGSPGSGFFSGGTPAGMRMMGHHHPVAIGPQPHSRHGPGGGSAESGSSRSQNSASLSLQDLWRDQGQEQQQPSSVQEQLPLAGGGGGPPAGRVSPAQVHLARGAYEGVPLQPGANHEIRFKEGVYIGTLDVEDGMTGYGKAMWNSGDVYVGEWLRDAMHGHGCYVWADGDCYEGEYCHGSIHGLGQMKDSAGTYVGDWVDEKRHGFGKMTYEGGNIYEGQWRKGKRDGRGLFIDVRHHTTYEGEFRNDKKEGHGVETNMDGDVYEGSFVDGYMHGRGTYTWANGSTYVGEFNRGIPVGQHILNAKDTAVDGRYLENTPSTVSSPHAAAAADGSGCVSGTYGTSLDRQSQDGGLTIITATTERSAHGVSNGRGLAAPSQLSSPSQQKQRESDRNACSQLLPGVEEEDEGEALLADDRVSSFLLEPLSTEILRQILLDGSAAVNGNDDATEEEEEEDNDEMDEGQGRMRDIERGDGDALGYTSTGDAETMTQESSMVLAAHHQPSYPLEQLQHRSGSTSHTYDVNVSPPLCAVARDGASVSPLVCERGSTSTPGQGGEGSPQPHRHRPSLQGSTSAAAAGGGGCRGARHHRDPHSAESVHSTGSPLRYPAQLSTMSSTPESTPMSHPRSAFNSARIKSRNTAGWTASGGSFPRPSTSLHSPVTRGGPVGAGANSGSPSPDRRTSVVAVGFDGDLQQSSSVVSARRGSASTVLPAGSRLQQQQPASACSRLSAAHASGSGTVVNSRRRHLTTADLQGWRPVRVIGKGSFGAVYKALLKDNTTVCCKVVELASVPTEDELHRLHNEVRLMKQLCHPNVVQYYGSLEENTSSSSSPLTLFYHYNMSKASAPAGAGENRSGSAAVKKKRSSTATDPAG